MSELTLPIYMDHHATTPLDPRVFEKMTPYFLEDFGNASSKSHKFGQKAHQAVEKAREQVSKAINAQPQEIIWTSGATEAINLAIKGLAEQETEKKHFVTVATEHKAVLDCFKWLESHGYETTIIGVDAEGFISLEELSDAIRPDTALVSVMFANNEIGVIQPIREIGSLCREKGCFFMTDATQALGREAIDVQSMNIDLLTCSAHKIYGPKGIGALYVRRSNPRVKLLEQLSGGGHERGMRSGTLNVTGIVGFGEAVDIAVREMSKSQTKLRELRDLLLQELQSEVSSLQINGSLKSRLAGNLNVSFNGVDADALVIALLDTVAVSTGSACTSEKVEPSHVLKALGRSDDEISSAIRFGLSHQNTEEQVKTVASETAKHISRLSALNFDF